MSVRHLSIVQMLEEDLANKNTVHYDKLKTIDEKFTYHFIDHHQQSYLGRSWFSKIFKIFNRTNLGKYQDVTIDTILNHGDESATKNVFGIKFPWFKTRTQNILLSWGLNGSQNDESVAALIKNLEAPKKSDAKQTAAKKVATDKEEQNSQPIMQHAPAPQHSIVQNAETTATVDAFIWHHQKAVTSDYQSTFNFFYSSKMDYDKLRSSAEPLKLIEAHIKQGAFLGFFKNRTREVLEAQGMIKKMNGNSDSVKFVAPTQQYNHNHSQVIGYSWNNSSQLLQ